MTVMMRISIRVGALFAICVAMQASAGIPPTQARHVVASFDSQLLATMKNAESLGFVGRYKKLAPQIDAAFDLPFIAQLALGDAWDTLSPAQQKAYIARFRKDTIATYATRFDSYDGERFEIVDVREATGDRRQVDTVLTDSDDQRTPISYVLAKNDGQWRIVNVVARGVSDLALKRGQYTGFIRNKGPRAFLHKLDRQLEKYPRLPET